MKYPIPVSLMFLALLAGCGRQEPAPEPAEPAAPAAAKPAPAPAAEPLNIQEAVQATATVESVDVANRLVGLRNADGEKFTVEVGPAVQNLPQLKVGDNVTVTYFQALGAEISQGAGTGSPVVEIGGAAAEPGQTPGAVVGRRVTGTVTIVSAQPDGSAVTFYRDDGLVRVLEVQRPEAREFVKGLKEGDKVDVTFSEAVAVSVEPVAAATESAAPSP